MLPSNVRNTNTNLGFSLAEIIVTVVIIGVLTAISIPNFLQMLERFQTNLTFEQVRGAIKEAQLQAIRRGQNCTLNINQITRTITTPDQGCLLNDIEFDRLTSPLPNPARIITNGNNGIMFTFQGHTNTMQTIVVFNDNQTFNKCLVISNGIGMMRWGDYTGNPNPLPNANSCQTQ